MSSIHPLVTNTPRNRIHGKFLVRDEPNASIVSEALERYASRSFRSQYEVKRFLDRQSDFQKRTIQQQFPPLESQGNAERACL